MVFTVIILILLLLFLLYLLSLQGRPDHPGLEPFQKVPIAHRGLHRKPKIPENSLAAFLRAIDKGYGIELDVHLLADGGLAVFHDHLLKRTTGAEGRIEDQTTEQLKNYTLEDSSETIPTLRQVLNLVAGQVPLVIELKCANNAPALCKAVLKELQDYPGPWCIESFDPRPLFWLRRHYPQAIRGQLTQNFRKEPSGLVLPLQILLSSLVFNFLTKPDFIAIKLDDRKGLSNRICRALWQIRSFAWTITSREQYEAASTEGYISIFEQFEP